jgi:hypothetical protein
MSGRNPTAQLEDRIRRQTEERLARARAEGCLTEAEVAPQGVIVEDYHDRKGFSEYGAPLSEGRGRPRMTSEQIRAARALARQREFQHPNGKPNQRKIARTMGWNERSVIRALESRQK